MLLNGYSCLTTTVKFFDNVIELQLASGGRTPNTALGVPGVQQLNGNISSALVYNRALSTAEILQNYNATKTRFGL